MAWSEPRGLRRGDLMADINADSETPTRPITLFVIAATGVLASACLGAATNAVNGQVSPRYFVTVMGWERVGDVWRAAIAQGVFEGLLFGLAFSLLFTVGTGIITRVRCGYGFAFKHIMGIVAAAIASWLIGGSTAMLLAWISPEFYRLAFNGVPLEFGPMLAYAWVGGSIWGVQFGGFASMILGLVVLRANWRRQPGQAIHDSLNGENADAIPSRWRDFD